MTYPQDIYGWCDLHEDWIDDYGVERRNYRCLDCWHMEQSGAFNWYSIKQYAKKMGVSCYRVRKMIWDGEPGWRLMDKTQELDPRLRTSFPLKKWFCVEYKEETE